MNCYIKSLNTVCEEEEERYQPFQDVNIEGNWLTNNIMLCKLRYFGHDKVSGLDIDTDIRRMDRNGRDGFMVSRWRPTTTTIDTGQRRFLGYEHA